jgi:cytochrome b
LHVWHPVVRLLHWTLAVLIVVDWIYDDGGYAHRMVGYAAVVVVLLRLTWAAVSRSHADLRPSITKTSSYLGLLLRGKPPRSMGHDPLGLWMVWLLWLLVLLLGLTGWMSRLDVFWGDDRVHDLHALLADVLAMAVVLHLAGVAVMSLLWKENLPAAMVTGTKRPRD